MSKYRFKNSNIYYEGTSIPQNLLDIKDAPLLHEIEKQLLEEAYHLFSSTLKDTTTLDEVYFKSLHEKTFSSLYAFAGKYRDVNMSKGESLFCQSEYLENEASRIFTELEKESYLKKLNNKKDFANRLAYYKGELIALHPFYELNGRILRLYCDLLAQLNGYSFIDYGSSVNNGSYIEASIACVQYADYKLLENIIYEGLM